MEKLLLTFMFFFPLIYYAQTVLTQDYEIYEYFNEDTTNKDKTYIWLYDGESYAMNFPKTVTGFEAIRDKVEYITSLSNVNQPTTNNSIIPEQYKDEDNVSKIYQLIMNGTISLFATYVIGDKRLEVVCTDKKFWFYITDNSY